MAYFTISVSFTTYTDTLLEDKARLIIASITGNADFLKAGPYLDVVIAATSTYAAARAAAANKATQNIADKNAARVPLELALKSLGYHIMAEAGGDEAKLKKTGYTVSKVKLPSFMYAPLNLLLAPGPTTGSMNLSVDAIKGCDLYIFQYCTSEPNADTVWVMEPVNKRKLTLLNLQPGARYWVRVGVKGSNNVVLYSAVASQYCL